MIPERKVLLVVNPISGGISKDDIFEIAINRSKTEAFDLRIYQTSGKDDASHIKNLVETLMPERVIVAGGDGTIGMAASAITGKHIILGIIPAGSANGLSVDFGIPSDFKQAMDIAFRNKFMEMDAILINGEISLHLSDIGLNALLIKNYEKGDSRGKIGYAKEMIKTLNEHNNFDVRIEANGQVLETEALIVIVANGSKYGTGVNINPLGSITDGKFEIIVSKKLDFIETAKILTGNTDYNPEVMRIISAREATISCTNGHAHFQMDGEYKGEIQEIKVSVVSKYMKVAVP